MAIIPSPEDYRKNPMLDKEFLETYSLYKWYTLKNTSRLEYIKYSSPVKQDCPTCRSEQTFVFKEYEMAQWMEKPGRANVSLSDIYKSRSLKINYLCMGCSSFEMNFSIRFSPDGESVQKIGQYPSYTHKISSNLKEFLSDEYLDLFKKGITCESQSYGIGACSYYRRIVELEIGNLLDQIESEVENSDLEEFKELVREAKESHFASNKINFLAKVIPSFMKPGGRNPLALLYEVLSIGIHQLNDDQCLEQAEAIRETLESTIRLLNANKDAISKLQHASSILGKIKK